MAQCYVVFWGGIALSGYLTVVAIDSVKLMGAAEGGGGTMQCFESIMLMLVKLSLLN